MTGENIIKQLWRRWATLSMLLKIVIINATVFVGLRLAVIIGLCIGNAGVEPSILHQIELPGDIRMLLTRPWTLITYMFAQYDVLHALFNMLWLYWFGQIFMLLGSEGRRMLTLYILGGLGGAIFYLSACSFLPPSMGINGWLIGSSAAVIAIVTATAILAPDYKMNLFFLGSVSLKWVAVVTIGLDLISVSATGSNVGGHIAHLGGAAIGAIYALALRHGHDLCSPFLRASERLRRMGSPAFSRPFNKNRRKSSGNAPAASAADRAELDRILDKIKQSGYTSLTLAERKRLFDVSRRIK